MADIIGSRLADQQALMHAFKGVVQAANTMFESSLISPLTITLGDEFQGIPDSISTATNIIIFLEEAGIHQNNGFKLRYVVQEGAVDTEINTVRAYEMLGAGLTDARFQLGKLKESERRFFLSLENQTLSELLNAAFLLFESIVDAWKPEKDYLLVSNFFTYKDYKKIAELLHKDRSLMWKREKSLNLAQYEAVKKIIASSINLCL